MGLIGHPSNCSESLAMFIQVHYYCRAYVTIFNNQGLFNSINFLNSEILILTNCSITHKLSVEIITPNPIESIKHCPNTRKPARDNFERGTRPSHNYGIIPIPRSGEDFKRIAAFI